VRLNNRLICRRTDSLKNKAMYTRKKLTMLILPYYTFSFFLFAILNILKEQNYEDSKQKAI
jgi:hypothetical protein